MNHLVINIFLKVLFLILKTSYIAKDIDIKFKKDIFGNKNNDPGFKDLPRRVKMVSQQ